MGSERCIARAYPVKSNGDEAEVTLEKRNYFPGRGEVIITDQVFAVARREEFSNAPREAERTFFRHVIIKKLDDWFVRCGRYDYAHIARPLGFEAEAGMRQACFYEWTFGRDFFPNVIPQPNGSRTIRRLEEWNSFVCAFKEAGIHIGDDITDVDNGHLTKNIIHQAYQDNTEDLNCFWKRIDFGAKSLLIAYDTLDRYLADNKEVLGEALRTERYELVALATRFLTDVSGMTERDSGKLDVLTRDYIISSSRHHRSKFSIH